MLLAVLTWLLAFFAQVALFGMVMFGLITLTDLAEDHINPHDATVSINTWVLPEYATNAGLAALLLLSGKWVTGALLALPLLLDAWLYAKKRHLVDVTEVFRQLQWEKKVRIGKLVYFLLTLVLVIYKLVEALIHGLLDESGRQQAHRLFKEAAATMR